MTNGWNVEMKATPAEGYRFVGWYKGTFSQGFVAGFEGECLNANAEFSFVLGETGTESSLCAVFEPIPEPLTPPTNVKWTGRTVSWDAVEGADSYGYKYWASNGSWNAGEGEFDMNTGTTTETSLDLSAFVDEMGSDTYSFQVWAKRGTDEESDVARAYQRFYSVTISPVYRLKASETYYHSGTDGGTVSGSAESGDAFGAPDANGVIEGIFAEGDKITITPNAASGYSFVKFVQFVGDSGFTDVTDDPFTFTLNHDQDAIWCYFLKDPVDPTLKIQVAGIPATGPSTVESIVVNGEEWTLEDDADSRFKAASKVIPAGTSVTVVMTVADDAMSVSPYFVGDVRPTDLNITNNDPVTTVTFTMPEDDATLQLSAEKCVVITYDVNGGTKGGQWPGDRNKWPAYVTQFITSLSVPETVYDEDNNIDIAQPPAGGTFEGYEVTDKNGKHTGAPGERLTDLDLSEGATIKLLWSVPETHTVTFYMDGLYPAPDAQEVEDGGKATRPTDPTWDTNVTDYATNGLHFHNWYNKPIDEISSYTEFCYTPDGGGCIFSFNDTAITEDTDVYAAYWGVLTLKAYNLTTSEELSGGTFTHYNYYSSGTSSATTNVQTTAFYNLPEFLKATPAESYQFAGWSTSKSKDDIISTDAEYEYTFTQRATLYALFEEVPAVQDPTLTIDIISVIGQTADAETAISSLTVNGEEWTITPVTGSSSTMAIATGTIPAGASVVVNVEATDNGMIMMLVRASGGFTDFDSTIEGAPNYGAGSASFTMPNIDSIVRIGISDAVVIQRDANGGTPGEGWSDTGKLPAVAAASITEVSVPSELEENFLTPPENATFAGIEITDKNGTHTGVPGTTITDLDFSEGAAYKYLWDSTECVTVKFDLNGGAIDGSTDTIEQVIAKGGKATDPGTPKKDNFNRFDGWYKGTDKVDLSSATFTEDTELIAQYMGYIEVFPYSVTDGSTGRGGRLRYNEGNVANWIIVGLLEGEGGKLTAVPNDGYRLLGWAETTDGDLLGTELNYVIDSYDGTMKQLYALFVKETDVTFDVNGGTKGDDWKESETVDVGSNLSDILGDTVPDSVPESVAVAPEGKVFGGYQIIKDEGIIELDNGAPIDVEITGATTVKYLWRGARVTLHWSSMDGVDLMDPIVTEPVDIGSTVGDALATIGKSLFEDVLFAKKGYVDWNFRDPKPITEYSGNSGLWSDRIVESTIVDGDMDIYVIMAKEIDSVEITVEYIPESGTETDTQATSGWWLWDTQTNRPSVSVPGDTNYELDTYGSSMPWVFWITDLETGDPFIGTFENGKDYLIETWLRPKFGYLFSEDAKAAVNGATLVFSEPGSAYTSVYSTITPTPVIISYDLNGGTLDGKSGTVTVETAIGETITLPAPTREGYTFDYWEGSRYEAGAEYTVQPGGHKFTAQWKKNEPKKDESKKDSDKNGKKKGGAKTGDPHQPILWMSLFGVSVLALIGVRRRRRG